MAYYLTFFCRSGEQSGASAMARFLAKLTETGGHILVERGTGDYVAEVAVSYLSAGVRPGAPRVDGQLLVQFYVGVQFIAEEVIAADPDNEHGIWGCDLKAELVLSGEADWPLVTRIWRTLADLWGAVAWDEISGFEINKDMPDHPHEHDGPRNS